MANLAGLSTGSNLLSGSSVKAPRGLVLVDGVIAVGVVSIDVENNSHQQADTFNVELSMAAQVEPHDLRWWSGQKSLPVEIYVGYPSNPLAYGKDDLTLLITGKADEIEFDFLAQTMRISGRDLTSRLVDNKRSLSFITLPIEPSNVVSQIAVSVGLVPHVVATGISVGAYTQIVQSLIDSKSTLWDVVCKLAQVVDYRVYVRGNGLYFEPKALETDNPYLLTWQAGTAGFASPSFNGISLKFSLNTQAARDIHVTVLSPSVKGKHVVEASSQKTRKGAKAKDEAAADGSGSAEPPLEYRYFSKSGLTQQEVQVRAEARAKQLAQHEMNMSCELPGDPELTTERMVQVSGTNTAYDQFYYPATISHSLSQDGGYKMSVSAKNISPDVEFS